MRLRTPVPHTLRHVVWLIPLLAAILVWQRSDRVVLDVPREHHRDVLRGFYAPEAGPSGAFRWSTRDAALSLPAYTTPAVLVLRGAPAPDGTRVTLDLGGRQALDLPPTDRLEMRSYRILLPADAAGGMLLPVRIAAAAPEQPVEARPLGMAIASAELRPLAPIPRLPPAPLLLALALLPALLAVCLEAAGAPPWAARALAVAAAVAAPALLVARPLAAVPLLLDLQAALGDPAVLRWLLAQLLVGAAAVPAAAFLFRNLPLRGLLFARATGLVLAGWLSWLLSVAGLLPFGALSVCIALAAVAGGGAWALRGPGLRDVAELLRRRWRELLAAEALFALAFFFGLWLRWNGAVGPAITGTEKPMDLALLQGALRDPTYPPADVWFAGEPVNYYYLGYVQIAAIAKLAGVTAGEAFNLGVATIFGLTALMVAGVVATLCALDGPRLRARCALPALLGVVLVLLAGNQMGALQLILGGSQVRVLDGGQLAEALVQRLSGAREITLSRPTPPAPDFGVLQGWTPAAEQTFDWYGPSRIVMDDIPTAEGVERRQAITEFPFFSFYLGDLHAHLLALPHGLLVLALALATLARPTLPVYLLTPRGWLELALTGAVLGSLYAVNAWDVPGWWLLFFGALALLYGRVAGERLPAVLVQHDAPAGAISAVRQRLWWLPHFVQSALGLGVAMLAAVGPFVASYRSPFGGTEGPAPWQGVPVLEALGRVLGPAPDHTRLHVFVAMFGLFLLPLLALAVASRLEPLPEAREGQGAARRRRLSSRAIAWAAVLLTLLIGQALGFPLLALLPLALWLALLAWRNAHRPARALALWGTAVGGLLVLAADSVYVRDQLEGFMSRYITVFKLYFQAWVLWGTLAAYALWATLRGAGSGARRAAAADNPLHSRALRVACFVLPFTLLLAGALVYPVETLRRGKPWGSPAREVDGLAFLARKSPGEAAAVAWLHANAGVDETVLTAWCECVPDEIGRAAAASGVPTLLGRSEGHQRLWRAGSAAWLREIAARERDIGRMYTSEDRDETLRLLEQYAVDYVLVGPVERAVYGAQAPAKFDELLELAFAHGDTRIYRLPRASP